MNKPKFDIVAISRNEEDHIPKMISSLKDFQERGGNVYVLDTGSTDNTVEVAKSLGCKVQSVGDMFRITIDNELADKINEKFVVEGEAPVVKAGDSLFDFASARNHCVSFTEQDMVSTMDCDEVFTKLDVDKINELIDGGYEQFEYNFVYNHDSLGNPIIKFKQSKFYNKQKVKWVGIIHEVLQGPAKVVYAGEDVIKLEHFQNEKTNRTGYLKGLAVDCFNNPENDRNSHYFAREMMYCGRFKSAIKEFENHISMGRWGTEAAQSMLYIGDCYRSLGDVDNMILWYLKSFDKEARREPLMRIAEHYYKLGRYPQVIAYCQAALTVVELPFYSNHVPYYENIPHELLYTAYWWTGKKEASKEHWKKAFKYCPTSPKYLSDAQFYRDEPIVNQKYDPSKFTGERYIPGIKRPDMEVEHYARYNFAAKYTEGKVVLDAACGAGYGEDVMRAKEYIGVDISNEDCKKAIIQDLENGINLDIKPDIVVSFETIEHLDNPHKFLQWVRDNAKQFIFSIPVSMPSEFHKQVYTVDEIKVLIGKYFSDVEFFEQDFGEIKKVSDNPRYIVGVANLVPLPKISFVIPTLGREEGLMRCLKSIENLNYPENLVEVIVKQDHYGEERIGVPKLVKQGVEESTGGWVVFASNDIEFDPEAINEALKVGVDGYVAFNTGPVSPDEGDINEHFMIRKDIIAKIGEVFDTDFYHVGVDNLLHAKMKKLGIFKRAEKAIVNHFHFTRGAAMDETYQLGWRKDLVEKDRELLAKKLAEIDS